jgi:hypothetical protein
MGLFNQAMNDLEDMNIASAKKAPSRICTLLIGTAKKVSPRTLLNLNKRANRSFLAAVPFRTCQNEERKISK